MELVNITVKLPKASADLSSALAVLVLAVVANHKAGAAVNPIEISADVMSAVQNLGPVINELGLLGEEIKADKLGMAEAFAIAGIEVARQLESK